MTPAGLFRLVLADGISADQQLALAAVMLGLVVLAAVFGLVEGRRIRRAREAKKRAAVEVAASAPPVVEPPVKPPPEPQLYQTPLAADDAGAFVPAPSAAEVVPEPPAPVPEVRGTPASPDEIGIVLPEHQPPAAGSNAPPGS